MSESDAEKYARSLRALIDSFERGGQDIDAKSLDAAVRDLIVDLIATQRNLDATEPAAREKIWLWAKKQMGDWDPSDPALTHPAKLLRLLAKTQDGSTSLYAEDLQGLRKAEESARQSSRASHPHKKDDFDRMLEGWLRRKPDLSREEAYEQILDARGGGVVIQADDQFIEIRPYPDADIKIIATSGLGSRLTRVRNGLKTQS